MEWFALQAPAWYLGEGWSLTPETAGLAVATLVKGLPQVEAGVDPRLDGPLTLMIGGRLLPGGRQSARVRVSIDGRTVSEQDIEAGFSCGCSTCRQARWRGGRLPRSSSPLIRIASPSSSSMPNRPARSYGFAEGWNEHEYDPSTGELWRWTSDRSAIRGGGRGRPLAIRIRGVSKRGVTSA
jgi:hypothetical protein